MSCRDIFDFIKKQEELNKLFEEHVKLMNRLLCPVSPHPCDPNHPSFLSGLAPILGVSLVSSPTGQGTRMLTVASHAGQGRFILSKI